MGAHLERRTRPDERPPDLALDSAATSVAERLFFTRSMSRSASAASAACSGRAFELPDQAPGLHDELDLLVVFALIEDRAVADGGGVVHPDVQSGMCRMICARSAGEAG